MVSKILVVDDEPDLEILFREKFRKKIKSNEIEFTFAHNGFEALEKLKANLDLNVVLTDLNMPEKDGLSLLSDLPKLGRMIKTVVVSAYGDMSNIRSAMNKGAFDFVIKPIDFQDLESTISRTFDQYNQAIEAQENKKRLTEIEKELDVARKLQQSMLPQNVKIANYEQTVELVAKMLPAQEVGGDFYDFFLIDAKHIGVIIADVSGKNIAAALLMSITKTLLHSISIKGTSPEEVFRQTNQILNVDNTRNMFVTAFYGVLNLETGELAYCNAGQPPPYVVRKNGILTSLGRGQGFPLGICEDKEVKELNPYQLQITKLEPKDSLVMYTDGITEAKNLQGNLYSEERLQSLLQKMENMSPSEILDKILSDNKTFIGSTPQSDDITVLTLSYKGWNNGR